MSNYGETKKPARGRPRKGIAAPWRLDVHAELDSTSDELIRIAQSWELGNWGRTADHLAVLALRQTRGRGQFGRVWQAPEGNLNLSLLLRPSTALRDAPQWSLAAGVGKSARRLSTEIGIACEGVSLNCAA